MATEKQTTNTIIKWLNQQPHTIATKIHSGTMQGRGLADIIACHYGHTILIETKTPGKQPTKIQHHTLHQWHKAGATTIIATKLSDVTSIIGAATWPTSKPTQTSNTKPGSQKKTKTIQSQQHPSKNGSNNQDYHSKKSDA